MSDSDDDEFLSASEGEEEPEKISQSKTSEIDKSIYHSIVSKVENLKINEESKEEEKTPEPPKKEETPLPEEVKEEKVLEETKEEEPEALKPDDEVCSEVSKSFIDVGTVESLDSYAASNKSSDESLPEEKKKLLSDIIKEASPEKTTKKAKKEVLAKKSKKEEIPKKVKAEEPEDDDGGAGWDDWGEQPTKPQETPSSQNDGWDDWSLIDEKKLPPKQEPTKSASKPATKESSNWGWGGIASAVEETFTTAIGSSFGFPSAEEFARKAKEADQKKEESAEPEQESSQNVPQFLPNVSLGMFSGILSGGMDVLESIGKKTFEAVTVTDPRGQGRRRLIFAPEEGQNLSDILKERRNQQEQTIVMGGHSPRKQLVDVATLFEQSEGMVHLEALEMLSNNRRSVPSKQQRYYVDALKSINTEKSFSADFDDALKQLMDEIDLSYSAKALVDVDTEISNRLDWCDGKSSKELYEDSVGAQVNFTAGSVQLIAKLANLLHVSGGTTTWTPFVELFSILSSRLNFISEQYSEKVAMLPDLPVNDDYSTKILIEASTAQDFIRQAHILLGTAFID